MIISICEYVSKIKTPLKPVLRKVNSSTTIDSSLLLLSKVWAGTIKKYFVAEDSACHSGTSKNISDAKNLIA